MHKTLSAAVFSFVLVMDQYTKLLATERLQPGNPEPVIDGLFNLTLVFNPGAAFGMFAGLGQPARHIALAAVTLVAFFVILRLALREMRGDRASLLALSAIFAGAVGNLIDRFRYDAVVDFLDFYWNAYHWPSFNVADSAISIGVAVVIIRMIFGADQGNAAGND